MMDLQQTLQRHGDNNGNLRENFDVDTGPAGLVPYIHVISSFSYVVLLRLAPGAGGI